MAELSLMSKNYAALVKQIASLQAEAEKVRRQEVDGVIARIRDAIAFYQLSAADLGFGARGPAKAPKVAAKRGRKPGKAKKTTAAIKFRDEAGNSWVGRGKRPQWLRDALAGGKQLDDFLVK
jgi:DNA-binding protein H-NS